MSASDFKFKAMFLMFCVAMNVGSIANSQFIGTSASENLDKKSVRIAGETKVQVHSDMNLNGSALAGFKKFQKDGGVYGAMYVSEDGTAFSWRSRRFSLEDATVAAQVDCEAYFKKACTLYATLVPVSLSEGDVFIPDQNIDTWEDVLRETKARNYIAIATNKSGASGFAWNFSRAADARAEALNTCQRNAAAKSKEPIARVVSANETAGVYDCHIFGVFR